MIETPLTYTIAQACAALNVSRSTLYALIKARRLASITLGRARRIPREAVEALARGEA